LPKAVKGCKDSQEAFDELNNGADPVKVKEWAEQEEMAQAGRDADESVMDIYDIKISRGQ
jgi:hypothetical protein